MNRWLKYSNILRLIERRINDHRATILKLVIIHSNWAVDILSLFMAEADFLGYPFFFNFIDFPFRCFSILASLSSS